MLHIIHPISLWQFASPNLKGRNEPTGWVAWTRKLENTQDQNDLTNEPLDRFDKLCTYRERSINILYIYIQIYYILYKYIL